MDKVRGLRVAPSAAVREKRLLALLQGRHPSEVPRLAEAVEDAQILGSLELSGFTVRWDEVKASREGGPSPGPIERLRRARAAVTETARFGREALLVWHREATGEQSGFRSGPRARNEGPPPAPAAFI